MKEKDYIENITRMSNDDIVEKYDSNIKRLVCYYAFLVTVTVGSLFICSPVALATLGVSTFRTYHINKNNELLEKRSRRSWHGIKEN